MLVRSGSGLSVRDRGWRCAGVVCAQLTSFLCTCNGQVKAAKGSLVLSELRCVS